MLDFIVTLNSRSQLLVVSGRTEEGVGQWESNQPAEGEDKEGEELTLLID